MNGPVEIVVAEVARLQLYRLKIRIFCRLEFSAVCFLTREFWINICLQLVFCQSFEMNNLTDLLIGDSQTY